MSVADSIDSARQAVHALEQATEVLRRHFGDTLDTRRLVSDVGRLADDVDLVCGAHEAAPAPAQPRIVIDDTAYAHDFWMDAEDEGLGALQPPKR